MIALALKMMHKRAVIVISNNLGPLYTRVLESLKIETSHSPFMPAYSLKSALNITFQMKSFNF
jgi:hypothetical protein